MPTHCGWQPGASAPINSVGGIVVNTSDRTVNVLLALAAAFFLWQGVAFTIERLGVSRFGLGASGLEGRWEDVLVGSLLLAPHGDLIDNVIVLDYGCSDCSGQHAVLRKLIAGGVVSNSAVRLLRDPRSPSSVKAALTAICAARQNAFSAVNLMLLEDASSTSLDVLTTGNQTQQLDTTAVSRCVVDPRTLEQLRVSSTALFEIVRQRQLPLVLSMRGGLQDLSTYYNVPAK